MGFSYKCNIKCILNENACLREQLGSDKWDDWRRQKEKYVFGRYQGIGWISSNLISKQFDIDNM
jgi:hypothetical protein